MLGVKDYVSIAYKVHQKRPLVFAISKNSAQHSRIKMKVLKLASLNFMHCDQSVCLNGSSGSQLVCALHTSECQTVSSSLWNGL